jgi:hypothetical protein
VLLVGPPPRARIISFRGGGLTAMTLMRMMVPITPRTTPSAIRPPIDLALACCSFSCLLLKSCSVRFQVNDRCCRGHSRIAPLHRVNYCGNDGDLFVEKEMLFFLLQTVYMLAKHKKSTTVIRQKQLFSSQKPVIKQNKNNKSNFYCGT